MFEVLESSLMEPLWWEGRGSHDHTSLTAVSTDTRTLVPGSLFIPLTGPHYRGHDFIPEALRKGAGGFLCSKKEGTPFSSEVPGIGVSDPLKALQVLSSAYRHEVLGRSQVIAITGSLGKTTLKEYLRLWLSFYGSVHVTAGNQNNEIGVPQTLLSAPEDTDFVVVEMGMRRVGDLEDLVPIVAPDVALLTCVQETHMSEVKNLEEVYWGKLALFRKAPDACWVGGGDDERIRKELAKNPKSISFGSSSGLRVRCVEETAKGEELYGYLIEIDQSLGALSGELITAVGYHELRGEHMSAALAVLCALNLDTKRLFSQKVVPVPQIPGRFALSSYGRYHVVDDAYNSSPASMKAGLRSLRQVIAGRKAPVQVVLILGDMLELGSKAGEYHRGVGVELAQLYQDLRGAQVVLVGELSGEFMYAGVQEMGLLEKYLVHRFKSVEDLQSSLWWQKWREALKKDEDPVQDGGELWVYLKASYSIGVYKLADELKAYFCSDSERKSGV